MLDLIRMADAYEAEASHLPGVAGHAAQNAADKLRLAAAAAAEADRHIAEVVNGDEPVQLAVVA